MTDAKIRLLLVDDQMIIRQGLRSLLEAKPDLEVVGEAENGKQAIAIVETLQPDVVLVTSSDANSTNIASASPHH